MENLNGIYIEATKDTYKFLKKLGLKTPETYERMVNVMGVTIFMVHDNKIKGTDGDPLKCRWFENPRKLELNDLKKLYRESNPEKTLNKFLNKLDLKEMPTFKEYNRIFEKLKEYLFVSLDDGLSIPFAFGLKDEIAERIANGDIEKEGDHKTKEILQKKYSKIFEKDDILNMDINKITWHPIYPALIFEIQNITTNGKKESFKYLLENIKLNNFDIDMLGLANAVRHSQNGIVEIVLNYIKDEPSLYDGSNGNFVIRTKLQNTINEELGNLSLELQEKFVKAFDWAIKPKFDLEKAVKSENSKKEQDQIERYKEIFPGLKW